MAAYYKVDVVLNSQAVSVGLPSPQSVLVTLPLVGPQGPQGPAGPKGDPGEVSGSIAWDNVTEKPTTFAPSTHTHVAADITDFTSAVEAVSPPADWDTLANKPASFTPSAHGSTHYTGGTDAIAAHQINGQTIFEAASAIYSTDQTLPANRARQITISNTNASGINITLPTGLDGALKGDTFVIIGGSTVAGPITIRRINILSPLIYQTLETITAAGQQFRFRADGASAGNWSLVPVDTHTHTASDITDLTTAAAAAAPVQSVNGNTGAVTVAVPSASAATPSALGTAAAGTSADFARADHVHAMPSASDVGAVGATLLDAKGDLIVASANDTAARLAVGGTNGHVLTVDSAETLGVKWAAAPAPDLASPPAIGNTTPAAGSFTTLNASGETELVNGTNAAGPLRVYNTFTSATNHERGFLRWSSNTFIIGTEAGSGGGSQRNMMFRLAAGRTLFCDSDTVDFRSASFSTILRLTTTLVQFSGTSTSFPALKRSSATLQVRLANDSAFTAIQGKLTTETAYTAGAPTATGYLVLYDSNGTAYKVPAEAL